MTIVVLCMAILLIVVNQKKVFAEKVISECDQCLDEIKSKIYLQYEEIMKLRDCICQLEEEIRGCRGTNQSQ